MAQIKSSLGVIRGKVGNNIFAKRGKTNVVYLQGKDTNESSTDPQILVRARMRPASATYQKLQQILNHSFNRQSPLLSRNDFMSYALRAEFFPYLEKGYVGGAIPGSYRITNGALNTVTAQVDDEGIRTNIIVPAGAVMTGASIVNEEQNADMIADKDQLTWIMFGVDAYGTPRWFYSRTSIENTDDPLPVKFKTSNGFLYISRPENMVQVLAGCVIRTNLGNTFLYSSEKLELNEDMYTEMYMSGQSYERMLQSYKKNVSVANSDLYLDELAGDQPNTGGTTGLKFSPVRLSVKSKRDNVQEIGYVMAYVRRKNNTSYVLAKKGSDGVFYLCNIHGSRMSAYFKDYPKPGSWTENPVAINALLDKSYQVWEYSKDEDYNIDPDPTPTPVHGMFIVSTVDGENNFVQANGNSITPEPATSAEDAVRISVGAAVSPIPSGSPCNYLKNAETGEQLEFNGNPVVRLNVADDPVGFIEHASAGIGASVVSLKFNVEDGYFSTDGEQAYLKAL